MAHWEVHHFTICDGWVNTWTVDGKPQTFRTKREAQKELKEFLADMQKAYEDGDISAPEDPDQYDVVKVED